MDPFVTPCSAGSVFAKRVTGTPFMQLCSCGGCWLAMVYVVATNSPCATEIPGSDHLWTMYSIRSEQSSGSSLVLPLAIKYRQADCVTDAVTAETFTLTVGLDTAGSWIKLGTVGTSPLLHVYIAAYIPETSPASPKSPICSIPEYAPPLISAFASFPSDPHLGDCPGPIRWRDVVPLAEADVGPLPDVGNGTGLYIGRGFGNGITTVNRGYCDPPLTLSPAVGPSACVLNVYNQPTVKFRSFNRADFTDPASPLTTDTTFNLDVTFRNPITGLLVDGTHLFDDNQEDDIDTLPSADLATVVGLHEAMQWSSITRVSFGVYRFNNMHFHAAKGVRRFRVWGDHQFGSIKAVTKFQIESGDITLNAGAKAFVDVTHPSFSLLPFRFKVNEVLAFSGGPIYGRILDALGDTELYNVVDGVTDTVNAALIDDGGNAIAAPVLNGTVAQACVNGIATFADLAPYGLGRSYEIEMTSGALGGSHNANWHSFPIEIVADLAFQALPTINAGVATSILVDIVDAFGSLVSPDTIDNLTLSGAGAFTGFGTVTPVAGTATFPGNFPAAGTYLIQVETSGVTYDGPGTASIPVRTISVTVLP